MKVVVEAMESCIDSKLLSTLNAVINEYEIHYSGDINELIIECDKLQSMLDEVEL